MSDAPSAPDPLAAPSASEVERFLARTDIVPHVQCKALIGRLAASVRDLEAARVRAEGERDERLGQLLYTRDERDANFRLLVEANARSAGPGGGSC